MNTDIAYKYLHPRHFKSPYVPGLPARDIYEQELLANDGWQKLLEEHIANGGGTFEKVEAPKKVTKKAEPAEATPTESTA